MDYKKSDYYIYNNEFDYYSESDSEEDDFEELPEEYYEGEYHMCLQDLFWEMQEHHDLYFLRNCTSYDLEKSCLFPEQKPFKDDYAFLFEKGAADLYAKVIEFVTQEEARIDKIENLHYTLENKFKYSS